MIEIIPNWHPLLVHFTIGLLGASTLLFLGRLLMKPGTRTNHVETAALWMLWLGAAFTILTLAAGFYAFATVGHDAPSHEAMKEHRNLALATATAFFALAGLSFFRLRMGKPLPGFFPWAMAAAAVLLGFTAWHGAELVYRHGLGVLALPKVEGEEHHPHADEADMVMDMKMETAGGMATDLAAPEGTVEAFHAALKHGDGAAAMGLLDPEVVIYESGYVERSAAEYAGHHLAADMEFSHDMDTAYLDRRVEREGGIATVASETSTTGTFKGKDYEFRGTETVVLKQTEQGWRITHIHWSSHPAGQE
jgi:uncharacterized membrane protein/ketosteroid isomerase-like protein